MKTGFIKAKLKSALAITSVLIVFLTLLPCLGQAKDKADLNEQLAKAAENGNLSEVESLLSKGASVNAKLHGYTALMGAIMKQRHHVIRYLLDHGADVNIKSRDGSTALMIAGEKGDVEAAKLLVENGADINAKNRFGSTAMTKAARWCEVDVMKFLADRGAVPPAAFALGLAPASELLRLLRNVADPNVTDAHTKKTPLICAACAGNTDAVRILLQNGAKIKDRDDLVRSALIWASWKDYVATARELLEFDAAGRPKIPWQEKRDALVIAIQGKKLDLCKLLIEKASYADIKGRFGFIGLGEASYYGLKTVVELLIEKGAEINAQDRKGLTALMLAAERRHIDVVRLLLNNGADVDAQTPLGLTPLMLCLTGDREDALKGDWRKVGAKEKGALEETARVILSKGPDVNTPDANGLTPLMVAAGQGSLDIVKRIVDLRADVNASADDCRTPLLYGAAVGSLDVVEYLIKKGANVNQVYNEGFTPLMQAALCSRPGVAKALIREGANVGARTETGDTALMCAIRVGQFEIVKRLIEKGVDINARDKDHNTVLIHAVLNNNNIEMVKLLVDNGAEVGAKNKRGCTAIDEAAVCADLEVFNLLVDRVGGIKAVQNSGALLVKAAKGGNFAVAELLLKSGADVNTTAENGMTPLMSAITHGYEKVRRKIDVVRRNCRTADGECNRLGRFSSKCWDRLDAVYDSIQTDNSQSGKAPEGTAPLPPPSRRDIRRNIVALLIKNGADVNAKDTSGRTALELAQTYKRDHIVRYLKSVGAH